MILVISTKLIFQLAFGSIIHVTIVSCKWEHHLRLGAHLHEKKKDADSRSNAHGHQISNQNVDSSLGWLMVLDALSLGWVYIYVRRRYLTRSSIEFPVVKVRPAMHKITAHPGGGRGARKRNNLAEWQASLWGNRLLVTLTKKGQSSWAETRARDEHNKSITVYSQKSAAHHRLHNWCLNYSRLLILITLSLWSSPLRSIFGNSGALPISINSKRRFSAVHVTRYNELEAVEQKRARRRRLTHTVSEQPSLDWSHGVITTRDWYISKLRAAEAIWLEWIFERDVINTKMKKAAV